MRRAFVALAALSGLGGCYTEAYVEPTPAVYETSEYVPYDQPAPVTVTMSPPPPRYEPIITCGYGTMWVPGRWSWSSRWYWARGYCAQTRPGYVYVAPRWVSGVYYPGHFAGQSNYYGSPGYGSPGYGSPGYGVRPAPTYGSGPYVAPPSPVVRPAPTYGGGYVAPAPTYRTGPQVIPPTPAPVVRPAPSYGGGTYVAPAPMVRPAPSYGGGTYVAPAPAVRPAPSYGGGSSYVAPAPAARPAPSYGGAPQPARPTPSYGSPSGGVRTAPPAPRSY